MSIFFNVGNTSVNINKIREISTAGNSAVEITFDDGSTDIYGTYGNADTAIERFDKTVVQLSPCSGSLYNVYKNDDGSYFHERVHCLALCADGEVRSLAVGDYMDLAVEARNFVGCFSEESLKNYPESTSA